LLEITNRHEQYTLPTFIDNVAFLAVEMCVVRELEEIFTPSTVYNLDDGMVKILASETNDIKNHHSQFTSMNEELCHTYDICSPHVCTNLGKPSQFLDL
jgi:hypothetical protein